YKPSSLVTVITRLLNLRHLQPVKTLQGVWVERGGDGEFARSVEQTGAGGWPCTAGLKKVRRQKEVVSLIRRAGRAIYYKVFPGQSDFSNAQHRRWVGVNQTIDF